MIKAKPLKVRGACLVEETKDGFKVWFPWATKIDPAFAACITAAQSIGLFSRNVSSSEQEFGSDRDGNDIFALTITR